jgi:hypothetical protein
MLTQEVANEVAALWRLAGPTIVTSVLGMLMNVRGSSWFSNNFVVFRGEGMRTCRSNWRCACACRSWT